MSKSLAVESSTIGTIVGACFDVATTLIALLLAFAIEPHATGSNAAVGDVHWGSTLFRGFGFELICFTACLVFFSHSHGLYATTRKMNAIREQRQTIFVTVVAELFLCGTNFLFGNARLSRTTTLLLGLITLVLLCFRRAIRRSVIAERYRRGLGTRNILIVGAGAEARALRNHLEAEREAGYSFRGFLSYTPEEAESAHPDIVGHVTRWYPLARALFVDEVILSGSLDSQFVIDFVNEAAEHGIDARVMLELYGTSWFSTPIEFVGQLPAISLSRTAGVRGAQHWKRVLDVTLSAFALLVLFPVLVLIAVVIRCDSNGPVFYRASRIGRKGRTFSCFKFRTMVPEADAMKAQLEHMNERDGILFKVTDDPRITRVGRILRRFSLDEIPQFFNVLIGDMSLVGPRPAIAAEVARYEPSHLRRLDVLPGITGLWQIHARQDPSFDRYISLDTAYVENWTFWLDLKILMRTLAVVIGGTGT